MRFRLFGFPVQVEPSFWVIAVLFGLNTAAGSMGALLTGMLIWLGILLVSLLVHELGHAFAARAYGESPHIVLHALGGRTVWSPNSEPTRVQRVIVTAAGPLAGYLLAAGAFVALVVSGQELLGEKVSMTGRVLSQLAILNVFWSTFNLLPVIPFDGGHIVAAILGKGRERVALIISVVVGVLGAIAFLVGNMMFGAIILGWAAATNWMSLRRPEPAPIPKEALLQMLTEARNAMDQGRLAEAHAIGRAVFEATPDADVRRRAAEIGAWSALLGGDPAAAEQVLERAPKDQPLDPYLRAAVLEASGQDQRAVETIAHARRAGDTRLELAALYIKALLKVGDFERAARVTLDIFDDTPSDDARRVAHAALDGGAALAAASLFERLFERTGVADDGVSGLRGFVEAEQMDAALRLLRQAVSAGLDPERVRHDDRLGALQRDNRFEDALSGT
ncbi:MAG: site-2 protease family protein [Polyangiaceae bacterium]|nr:site-2 protease family protein [Myxococcales bacterium]MCB9586754.1 site-2 protease family protein [Polyangiaceae bacterium]MCB9606261.1 site-2 protease family protein [Polyangiaceae bacterium]